MVRQAAKVRFYLLMKMLPALGEEYFPLRLIRLIQRTKRIRKLRARVQ